MNYKDKVVIITGANGVIGKAVAKAFAEEGARLSLVSRRMEALEALAKELKLRKEDYILVAADVSKEEDTIRYVQETKDAFGRIDVFFNNAGIGGVGALLLDYPTEVMEEVIDINLKGAYRGLKHVLKVMVEQKSGSIVNMSSIGGYKGGLTHTSAYIAAKHGVSGITKAAAVEYGRSGVRINAVCPGQVNSEMIKTVEKGLNPDDPQKGKDFLLSVIPMGRYAEPYEVADAVLFLASDKASFITGVTLLVDGGLCA